MDLAHFRDTIGRRWPIVLASTLLCGAFTGVLAERRPPVYRAETQMLVTFAAEKPAAPQPRPPADEAGRLMQRRVKTYATMMNTPRLTRPVIDSLGLPYTTDDLAGRVVASSTVDSLAIDVAVTDRSADMAAAIAAALAAELQRIAGRDLPPAGLGLKAQVAVVRAAAPPPRPEPVRWQWYAAGGALGGLAVGAGIALVLGYRRAGTPVSADVRTLWATTVRRRPAAPADSESPGPASPVPDDAAAEPDAADHPAAVPGQSDGRVADASVRERQAS
ncbi:MULTISPECIES: lipopolysaccharide biosynthesis protein [unclassified Micromonospora]|uniref:YveK family protein n=1 Tax=unclassified Micromonospora TaxID=2617518 RepID=UPI001C22C56A|nr:MULTISPECIES: lipopolysaccharide biosynthesis protein [unclassified Micromonospora]MBU8859177.1 lipopolysaccharide biosynthesis protein [Micromonospora sp. WMMB482]MDM4778686.1 lipopolysaccharide biosynthesis protein [Micromonospora sp. b486]